MTGLRWVVSHRDAAHVVIGRARNVRGQYVALSPHVEIVFFCGRTGPALRDGRSPHDHRCWGCCEAIRRELASPLPASPVRSAAQAHGERCNGQRATVDA